MSRRRLCLLPPRRFSLILCVTLLASCGLDDAQLLELNHLDGKLDLAAQVPGNWDRICMLMPYATSGQAEKLLGFSFVPDLHSSIGVKDDRTLLVAARGNEVVGSFEVLRRNTDFAKLGPSCYPRSKATFKCMVTDGGWNEISIP